MTTLVVTATPAPGEEAARDRYLQAVFPLLVRAGGIPVKRLAVTGVVSGGAGAGIVLLMDFAEPEVIGSVFESDEYAALIPERDRGFTALSVVIAEDIPDPGRSAT